MQAPPPQVPRKLNPRGPIGHHGPSAPAHANAVASGPTVLLEDSQVFPATQTPLGSQVVNRTPRVRTILSAEAEEEAIQLTSEGKITTKNAWSIKLLEGIHDSVSNALSNTGSGEDAAQFTKCANLVEGGAKIWTQRVEHTAARSNQIVRRLHRTDGKDDEDPNGEGDDGTNNPDDGDTSRRATKKAARKKERTVAECLSEINLDPKARALALLQSGSVSAQFRAITEKFEQGHAQGLLLNNAPMGSVGNLILDVDYSRTATAKQPQNGQQRRSAEHHHATEHIDHLGHASPSRPRLSTHVLATEVLSPENSRAELEPAEPDSDLEQPFVLDIDIHVEPPNQRTSWGSMSSGTGNAVLPAGRRGGRGSTQMLRATPTADELYVPNMSQQVHAAKPEVGDTVSSPQTPGRGSEAMGSSPRGRSGSRGDVGWNDDGGGDDDYDGPDADYGGNEDDDDDGSNHRAPSQSQSEAYTASRAASSVRDLISGAAELAYFDHMMGAGAQQLAVAADDPNSWFPMTQTDATNIGLQRGSSYLQQIRRETLLQQRTASQEPSGQAAAGARKKARTEKQGVVAVGESIDDFIAPTEVVALASNDNKLMNPRRENLRKPTEDFKERFYYKRSTEIAVEHNLLLVDVDTKGALPWWLPQQATDIAGLFQPFSSPSMGWNVLNKRVATSDDAARIVGPYGRGSALVGEEQDDGADRDVVGDMPLRVFDDDEMEGGDDFGDDGLMDDDGDDVAYAAGFDLPRISVQDDDVDPDHGTDLGHFVAGAHVEGGTGEDMLDIMERPDVIRALESHHATVPTQVDVVRLRRIMWHHTQRLIKETAPETVMVPKDDDAETAGKRGARSFGRLKRQTQLKRGRDDDSDEGGDADASSLAVGGDDSAYHGIPLHRFSHVVAAMLPQIPSVSTTGSLSPAFFFFSLLFLANEHGILLENVKGNVQDIFISGLLDDPAAHH